MCQVKWVEEGEKNTKYENFKKSRANSKIMERVTDKKGRTFTKHTHIMNVQIEFFSNQYWAIHLALLTPLTFTW